MVPVINRKLALALRQHSSHLHQRLPRERLVEAAYAGLQDSSPRSAVFALHARVLDVSASDWENSHFAQVWGPRGAVYVVPKTDVSVFTIGRMPRERALQDEIEASVRRIAKILGPGRARTGGSRERVHDLRRASITGRVRIRWDGSKTSWWLVDPPKGEVEPARLELARRFLHSIGPSTPEGFSWWFGGTLSDAQITFRSLGQELSEVRLENQQSWVLEKTIAGLKQSGPAATVRLLPPGDPYLGAPDRELLVPKSHFRSALWPKSVWPGALFVHGELVGTWRRQQGQVVIHPWRKVSSEEREAVCREVQTIPVESKAIGVTWT